MLLNWPAEWGIQKLLQKKKWCILKNLKNLSLYCCVYVFKIILHFKSIDMEQYEVEINILNKNHPMPPPQVAIISIK